MALARHEPRFEMTPPVLASESTWIEKSTVYAMMRAVKAETMHEAMQRHHAEQVVSGCESFIIWVNCLLERDLRVAA